MLTVHHLNNSRSQRVLWLLEELGVEYTVKRYERDARTMLAPAELKAVHPLGKSPVITHDGRTVAETGAIVEYLLDEFDDGRLRPAVGTDAFLQCRYWLHYAEGSAMPPLLLTLVFGQLPTQGPALLRPVLKGVAAAVERKFVGPQRRLHVGYWNDHLSRNTWFAGDAFSAADIMMSFPLEAAAARGGGTDRYPHLEAALEAMQQRPAYQRALERGGPYDMRF